MWSSTQSKLVGVVSIHIGSLWLKWGSPSACKEEGEGLSELVEQQQRELKERGLQYPFGISTSRLLEHFPKVNSKWLGLPDDKNDAILAAEKQKKKVKPLVDQRRCSMSKENQGKVPLYASHFSPNLVPPNSHRSRHSISSANTHTTSSSNSESFKSCDPNARQPQIRQSSSVPSWPGQFVHQIQPKAELPHHHATRNSTCPILKSTQTRSAQLKIRCLKRPVHRCTCRAMVKETLRSNNRAAYVAS